MRILKADTGAPQMPTSALESRPSFTTLSLRLLSDIVAFFFYAAFFFEYTGVELASRQVLSRCAGVRSV